MSTKPLDTAVPSPSSDGAAGSFDPAAPYRLSESVSLRPEPFGALVYDFTTRKLSFLKTVQLVEVVRGLADQPDARSAVEAAGVPAAQHEAYLKALAGLLQSRTIVAR
ncbi:MULTISPECIES: mycofactocin biosynthesis chaperone MftB [unclassified Pseudonocardia]|uniref:mycofactocin biosynthesis chaperone MftB n=1 Tax=unclassified Pseudonocardia TaxID=2619320 RepID=UPI0001FFE502|nr:MULTISPECIES: mycofactocin biosynthesis chaperone MftB [unclassified Pseudonocardia]ALL75301.1 mycofactocin system RPExFGAL protein [Pseudonocardia sp. EC080610-09]ALL82326.1 mycofactocin system RPExFGAL protein [Pseudonocardia sp. EC080619-01]ALE72026.1 mycofactocin system RPExFGAL protein [Pseudonocardia sp. EC080625-04]OLL74430.1 Mycofactocin system small protein [Pseudonocardia sp. Ae150A_Ps1]OLL85463.1 Mycofactocin system small protein [Pseudonocardia sp. Ae263_Ps1]